MASCNMDMQDLTLVFSESDQLFDDSDDHRGACCEVEKLNSSVFSQVCSSIEQDASVAATIKTWLLSLDADILYKQMEWLDGCLISAKGQRPRAVEVVWKQFHQRLAERVKSTDCRQGFSFLSLKLMQKLVELNYRFRPNTETCNEIDERDKDILSYIAGYLIRRTSSRHASSKELVDKDAPPSGMIQLFDRGGLLVPRQGFVDVIIDFENSFRELPRMSVDINQFFKTLDTKGSFVSFQQLFDYRTSFEEQENCFLAITSLFFKVRAHQKCRQIFEKSLRNKSAQQKSKAVRDVLTKS